jgi:hypothetical protein
VASCRRNSGKVLAEKAYLLIIVRKMADRGIEVLFYEEPLIGISGMALGRFPASCRGGGFESAPHPPEPNERNYTGCIDKVFLAITNPLAASAQG